MEQVEAADAVMLAEREADAALTDLVALARELVRARVAWLMLPADGPHELQLAAVSEWYGRLGATAPPVPPVALPVRRAHAGDHILAPIDDPPTPTRLSHCSETPRSRRNLSVPVVLSSDTSGTLHVADPLARGGFTPEDAVRLGAFATCIAEHLALRTTSLRLDELRQIIRRQQRQVVEAQEDERRRIARDLHDATGHDMSAAILRLDLAAMALPTDAAQASAALEHARASLVECAESLHDIVFHLRPPILQDLGLVAAIGSLISQATEVERTRIALVVEGRVRPLPEELELAVFRVVQEALTNIRKHASASEATVCLDYASRWLTIRVEDDGIGFCGWEFCAPQSSGLTGMRERVALFAGSLTVRTRPTGGLVLLARLPLAGQ